VEISKAGSGRGRAGDGPSYLDEATKQCWSRRSVGWKHEISKRHPVGASPTRSKPSQRAGSEPCCCSGNGSVDAWGTERVGRR